MFFKKNNNISVANLYLCLLGLVSYDGSANDRSYYSISSAKVNKPYAILELKEETFKTTGTSPVNGVTYTFFYNCSSHAEFVGRIMIFKIIPLVQLNGIKRNSYTKEEIQYLEDELNKKPKVDNVTNDPVMREIKKLADKSMEIFNENIRNDLFSRINSLGVFYVTELINIRSKNNRILTIVSPELALISECTKQMAEIEAEINTELANNSLRQDLEILERSIRGNNNDRQ